LSSGGVGGVVEEWDASEEFASEEFSAVWVGLNSTSLFRSRAHLDV